MLSHSVIEKNPDSIGQQLLGSLLSYVDKYPCVNKLVKDIRDTCMKSCHLLPLSSWLELEGPEVFTKNVDSPLLSLVTSNSSTGTIVISGLANGLIKIHELETGKELKVLVHDECQDVAAMSLALSHSKAMLASSSLIGPTILWEMNTYEQRLVLPAGDVVDFSVDDRRLYTGCFKGQLKMWCVITGELLGRVPAHNKQIRSLCTTKDGLYIATGSEDNTIKLWRADTLVYETTLVGHTRSVMCVVATNVVNS
ncbi:WD40 repeat domain-containing [Paramuricea clavata]|uniref:WD40 repeat domain-containing n=1 Tax=Paramuricea clavata TaxID=317549 RepID=A0A6S7HA97_PARCT|nr:WD40 repeat domain-containing [Paramuricea clavata]